MTFKPVDGANGEGMNSFRVKHLYLSPTTTRIQPWFQLDYRLVGCNTNPCGEDEHEEETMMNSAITYSQQVRCAMLALLRGYTALAICVFEGVYSIFPDSDIWPSNIGMDCSGERRASICRSS